uniref:Putative secreted protein n=1 Tax=Ixodes ricinus TaxID=34613 RepID=A0A6B0UAV9_IXORI
MYIAHLYIYIYIYIIYMCSCTRHRHVCETDPLNKMKTEEKNRTNSITDKTLPHSFSLSLLSSAKRSEKKEDNVTDGTVKIDGNGH